MKSFERACAVIPDLSGIRHLFERATIVRFGFTESPALPQQIREVVVRQTIAILRFKYAAVSAFCRREVALLPG
jgi:hypothetical protein